MLTTLLSAFAKDAVTTASTMTFFEASKKERAAHITKTLGSAYPEAMQTYLATVSAEGFAEDLQALLPVITSAHGVPGHLLESTKESTLEEYRLDLPPVARASTGTFDPATVELSPEFLSDVQALFKEIAQQGSTERRINNFVQAFCQTLITEVAQSYDEERGWETPPKSAAASTLTHLLATGQNIPLGREIQAFLNSEQGIASPTIQSPVPLSAEDKHSMRTELQKRYPGSFPSFEVEPSLGGGVRLFYQGALLDESWITQVARVFAHVRPTR